MATPRRARPFAVFLLLMLLGAVGYYALTTIRAELSIRTLENRLSTFIIPPITHDGRTYTVEHGHIVEHASTFDTRSVLNIARFIVEHRIDPIFAFEGLRRESMKEGLPYTHKTLAEVLPFFESEIREMMRTSLYPNEFLALVPDLEYARENMLHAPSAQSIEAYERILEVTIEAYMEDIENLIDLVYASDTQGLQKYGFFDGITDRDTILKALRDHQRAARIQYTKARTRYACYHSGVCHVPENTQLQYAVERAPIPQQTLTAEDHKAADEIYVLNEAFHSYLWSQTQTAAPTSTKRDMFALADLACYPGSSEILFGEFKTPFLPSDSSKFEPLDDVYFYDTDILDAGPYFSWLRSKGIRYQHHTSNAPYMCLSSGETHKRLSRLQYIRDYLRDHPLFLATATASDTAQSIGADRIIELIEGEQAIRESDIANESDVYNYLESLAYILNTHGEVLLEQAVPTSARHAVHLIHIWNQGSQNLSADITYISYLTAQQPFILIHRKKSPAEFVYPRAYMSLLLMSYNRSVIPSPTPALIKTRDIFDPQRYGYTTYRTGILKERTVEDIKELITRSNIFSTTFNESENPLPENQ